MSGQRMVSLHDLLAHAGEAAVAMEPDGRIVLWNDAAEALLGHTQAEVVGRRCWDVLAGCDARGARVCRDDCPVMHRANAGEPVASFDLRVHTKAGRLLAVGVSTLAIPATAAESALFMHLIRTAPGGAARRGSGPPPPEAALATGEHGLTRRELEVLNLTRDGASTRLIAARLRVSGATVRNHTQSILRKLGVHSRLEAVAVATRRGLLA